MTCEKRSLTYVVDMMVAATKSTEVSAVYAGGSAILCCSFADWCAVGCSYVKERRNQKCSETVKIYRRWGGERSMFVLQ